MEIIPHQIIQAIYFGQAQPKLNCQFTQPANLVNFVFQQLQKVLKYQSKNPIVLVLELKQNLRPLIQEITISPLVAQDGSVATPNHSPRSQRSFIYSIGHMSYGTNATVCPPNRRPTPRPLQQDELQKDSRKNANHSVAPTHYGTQ